MRLYSTFIDSKMYMYQYQVCSTLSPFKCSKLEAHSNLLLSIKNSRTASLLYSLLKYNGQSLQFTIIMHIYQTFSNCINILFSIFMCKNGESFFQVHFITVQQKLKYKTITKTNSILTRINFEKVCYHEHVEIIT